MTFLSPIAHALPFGLALLLAWIATRPWSAGKPAGYWAAPLAIGASLAIGLWTLEGQPNLAPTSAHEWLFHLAVLLAIVGLIDALIDLPGSTRVMIYLPIALIGTFLLLEPRTRHAWDGWAGYVGVGLIGYASVAGALVIEPTHRRRPGALVLTILAGCTLAAAGYMMLTASASFAQRAGSLAAAVAGLAVAAAWARHFTLSRGGAMAWAVLYGGLLSTGYAYVTYAEGWTVLLLGAAPLVGLIPLWTPLRGWKLWLIATAATLLPVLIALIPTLIEFNRRAERSGGW